MRIVHSGLFHGAVKRTTSTVDQNVHAALFPPDLLDDRDNLILSKTNKTPKAKPRFAPGLPSA
jgi:hypothetical protein